MAIKITEDGVVIYENEPDEERELFPNIPEGGGSPEQITQAVNTWLEEHPEATTTVQDGSITKTKLDYNLQTELDSIDSEIGELKENITDLKGAFDYNIENLVNDDNTNYGWITSAGWRSNEINDVYKQRVTDFIPVSVGEEYTAFLIASQAFRICVTYYSDARDGNTAFISQTAYDTYSEFNGERYNKYTFTIPTDCTYIRVYYYTCDESNYYLFNTTVKNPLGLVTLLEKYYMPILFEKIGYIDAQLERGTFNDNGLNQDSALRTRTIEYIPVVSGQKYTIEAYPKDQTKILKVAVSFYNANDYTTARTGVLQYAEAPTTITIPTGVTYVRLLVAFSNDANILPSDVSACFVKKVYPHTATTPTDFAYDSAFAKKEVTITRVGILSGVQSFCKYNGKYYSADTENLYVQDESFAVESTTALSLGHANALQLGHNGKAFASGWDDQKVYEVDLTTLTIINTYTLPTTGYTTVAVDDVNKLMYIFQRETYPDTLENYNFIVYDYANEQIINTKKTTMAFGGMQAVDFVDGRIFVLNGFGTTAVPNGYRIYNTNSDVIAEYVIGSQASVETEGVFVDRDTKEIYISYVNKYLYKIS